ncbi:MAG TPA: NAD(P)-dependent oxidoreductase [Propionicimonas sp.]|jgi:nucleoside-diphosphate-sugar epimerase
MKASRSTVDVVRDALSGFDGTVAITGATGWLGCVALDLLYGALGEAAPEHVVGYASSSRHVTVADGRVAPVLPLAALPEQDPVPAAVLHFAFLTPDRLAAMGPADYAARNRAITGTVVTAVHAHRPAWLVVASSGAVYGAAGASGAHPYVDLKREAEQLLQATAAEVGTACVVPRIFSLAGPRLPRGGMYALGDMLEMAAAGGPITIRAGHEVHRAYSGADEVVALAVSAAARGQSLVFDTSGEDVELGDLAARVARAYGLGGDAVRRGPVDGRGADVYVGEGGAMRALADEAGLTLSSLDDLIRASVPGA